MSMLVVNTLDDFDDEDDDDEEEREVLIPKVKSEILEKVIEFCNHYKNVEEMTTLQTPLQSSKIEDLVQGWYVDFCNVNEKMLFELVAAADFMDIKPLLELSCFASVVLLKGKNASDIRRVFKMNDDPNAVVESR